MPVHFPKYVSIHNPKLTVLYWVLMAITAAWVVVGFVAAGEHLFIVTPRGFASFWAGGWKDRKQLAERMSFDQDARFCKHPEEYEYWFDLEGLWHYENITCVDLCSSAAHAWDDPVCIDQKEVFVKEESGIFFPTLFMEHLDVRGPDCLLPDGCIKESLHFVKGVEHLSIDFDHFYEVYTDASGLQSSIETGLSKHTRILEPDMSSRPLDQQLDKRVNDDQSQIRDLFTVVHDSHGCAVHTFKAGESVSLEIADLLRLAGFGLDDVSVVGKNLKPNATNADGPLYRLSGVQLYVDIQYYNERILAEPEIFGHPGCEARINKWQRNGAGQGPVAVIRIRIHEGWTSFTEHDVIDSQGSHRHRYYYGIRIRFGFGGQMGWFSTNNLFTNLAAAIVFLQLPKLGVFYFTVYCLQKLSKMYSRAIYQDINVQEQISKLGGRLMMASSLFDLLRGAEEGIACNKVHELISAVLSKGEKPVEEEHIQQFCRFVYARMATDDLQHVDLLELARCLVKDDIIHIDNLSMLANWTKRHSILERLFMDWSLHRDLNNATMKDIRHGLEKTPTEQALCKVRSAAGHDLFHVQERVGHDLFHVQERVVQVETELRDAVNEVETELRDAVNGHLHSL